jgi:hypothetical protein
VEGNGLTIEESCAVAHLRLFFEDVDGEGLLKIERSACQMMGKQKALMPS